MTPLTVNDPAHWLSTPFLETISFQIHTYLKVFVCMVCKKVWVPSAVLGHAHSHGSAKPTRSADQELATLAESHDLRDRLQLKYPKPNQEPIKGLQVHKDAYLCKIEGCGYACSKESTMQDHWKTMHQRVLRIVKRRMRYSHPVHIQSYCEHTYNRYWAVNVDLSDRGPSNLYALYTKTYLPHVKPPEELEPMDDGELTPWLTVSGYLDYLGVHATNETKRGKLVDLARRPSRNDDIYGTLHDWMFDYLTVVCRVAKRQEHYVFLKNILCYRKRCVCLCFATFLSCEMTSSTEIARETPSGFSETRPP
jgi:hypothetical protein